MISCIICEQLAAVILFVLIPLSLHCTAVKVAKTWSWNQL